MVNDASRYKTLLMRYQNRRMILYRVLFIKTPNCSVLDSAVLIESGKQSTWIQRSLRLAIGILSYFRDPLVSGAFG